MNQADRSRIRRLVFENISKHILDDLENDLMVIITKEVFDECRTVEEVAVARATIREVAEAIMNFPVEMT